MEVRFMKRKKEKGGSAIKTILVLAVLGFGGLFGFQTISSILVKSDIHTEISDRMGRIVGDSFSPGEMIKIQPVPLEVLRKYEEKGKVRLSAKDISAIRITHNEETGKVEFYYQYTLVLNLLVTEKTEFVTKHGTI
jgi:hypothetical protein